MASLFPPVPPDAPPPAGAEERFVRALAELPDAWRVYHGLTWYDTGGAGVREGEADAVLLHPEHGLLVLEVKGGGIAFDGDTGKWTSTNDAGVHPIQDPFRQAQRSEKALADQIARRWSEISDGPLPAFVHGHGVAFPDCAWGHDRHPVGAPRELVIDRADLEAGIVPAVDRLVRRWRSGRDGAAPLGSKPVKRIGQVLLKSRFELAYLPLVAGFARDDERLASLTPAQQVALDFLGANPRGRVQGFAGTGKTVIAFEHALRLVETGRRVLFLCFNLPLAAELRRMAGPVLDSLHHPLPDPSRLWIGAFHQLTEERVRRAGLDWDPPLPGAPGAGPFWEEEAPRLLLLAGPLLPDRFDALVVDEEQDFRASWWPPLASLLQGDAAPLAFLCDPNQDLWSRGGLGDAGGPSIPVLPLRTVLRTTRAIARWCSALVGGPPPLCLPGTPEGEQVQLRTGATPADRRAELEKVARYLLETEKLDADRLLVIGTRRLEHSSLADEAAGPTLRGIPVVAVDDEGQVPPGSLRYATPHRIKGLEADVVLLIDVTEGSASSAPANLYVAASRARHRLVVVGDGKVNLPVP